MFLDWNIQLYNNYLTSEDDYSVKIACSFAFIYSNDMNLYKIRY